MKTLFVALAFLSTMSVGARADEIFVRIANNQEFNGEADALTSLKFVSGFGEVDFPMESISGIKLNANANGDAVVVFKNGDTISGKLVLETIVVKTSWGKAHINVSSVDSITFDKLGRFYSEKNGNATVWRFSNDPPVTEGQGSSLPRQTNPAAGSGLIQ